jgi:hypothetical protein
MVIFHSYVSLPEGNNFHRAVLKKWSDGRAPTSGAPAAFRLQIDALVEAVDTKVAWYQSLLGERGGRCKPV